MDLRTDRLATNPDGRRGYSSFSHQGWPQHSSYISFPLIENPVQESSRQYESTLDEPARTYRAPASQGLKGNSKPWFQKYRQASPSFSRSSTSISQPVLVRSYSGNTHTTATDTKMPSRKRFSFTVNSETKPRGPALPSENEFSIESILEAIGPDIRNTLDSIAEICGRSKLSLANEYGSHIAPLGEIRAPPGGLVTVEEASPDHERQPADNEASLEDENSNTDWRDRQQLSYSGYREGVRQAAAAHNAASRPTGYFSMGEGSSAQVEPDTPGSAMVSYPAFDPDPQLPSLSATREFTSSPKPSGRALLGRSVEPTVDDMKRNKIAPAVVSEVHLDAKADYPALLVDDDRHSEISSDASGDHDSQSAQAHIVPVLAELQTLLSWFRGTTRSNIPESCQSLQSAETRLRAMLERQNGDPPVAIRAT